jgi:SAM-dependent methyltransferase
VVNGYFPSAISSMSKFDVIIFNDVFEHIPDIAEILKNCRDFLNDDGVLVLSLPNSNGFIFNVSRLLAAIGIVGPWRRLWQVMFYTPHVHYFNESSLNKLLIKYFFKIDLKSVELDAVTLSGLWDRLAVDKSSNILKRIFLFFGISLFYPILKISKKDAFFSIYKK